MYRVAICDDNACDLAHLRMLLEQSGVPVDTTAYDNGETLLWDVETGAARFDLYLLDIYLTGISGLQVAERIGAVDKQALVVFVSTSEEFFKDAFAMFAFTYLVKPVSHENVNIMLEKAVERLDRQEAKGISITFRGKPRFLRFEDIAYISSANHSVCFHLRDGGEQAYYGKLDEIAPKLAADSFVRCHQSYIVNLSYVKGYGMEGFSLEGAVIPVSRTYAEAARQAHESYLFRRFEPC